MKNDKFKIKYLITKIELADYKKNGYNLSKFRYDKKINAIEGRCQIGAFKSIRNISIGALSESTILDEVIYHFLHDLEEPVKKEFNGFTKSLH